MIEYRQTITLRRSQWAPVFIPDPDTIRIFKKVRGENWEELDRVDLADTSAGDTYSYDDIIRVILFHPAMIGNEVKIYYKHDNIPNPGTLDTLPTILAEQAIRDYNKINTGLFVSRDYVEGEFTGWNGMNLSISGGIVTLSGNMYTVGTSYWDLAKMGAQAGDDIVTVVLFYINESDLSDKQKNTKFVESPNYFISKRYNFDNGNGLSSALTELNQTIESIKPIPGFIEIMKMVVHSQKDPEPPVLNFFYEPLFRVYHMI